MFRVQIFRDVENPGSENKNKTVDKLWKPFQLVWIADKLHDPGAVVHGAGVKILVVHGVVPQCALVPIVSVAVHQHDVWQYIKKEQSNWE